MKRKFLMAMVVVAAVGCATPQPAAKPASPNPPLDSRLSAPCKIPDAPVVRDYDVWQAWVETMLLVALGDCASRHAETVAAWPK